MLPLVELLQALYLLSAILCLPVLLVGSCILPVALLVAFRHSR